MLLARRTIGARRNNSGGNRPGRAWKKGKRETAARRNRPENREEGELQIGKAARTARSHGSWGSSSPHPGPKRIFQCLPADGPGWMSEGIRAWRLRQATSDVQQTGVRRLLGYTAMCEDACAAPRSAAQYRVRTPCFQRAQLRAGRVSRGRILGQTHLVSRSFCASPLLLEEGSVCLWNKPWQIVPVERASC